ncbi:MAG: PAS domain-containing sensor histidine kinase [Longimicrobiales bacterium]|jgi:PAS domain S-box-containing protein
MTSFTGGKPPELNPAGSLSEDVQEQKTSLSADVILRRARLRAVIDAIPDLISVKDCEGVYQLCNQPFSEYVGLDARSVLGKTDVELFDEGEALQRSALDDEVLRGEKTLRSEGWHDAADGRTALFDTLEAPFYNYEGELLGLIKISRDITERHRIAEELRDAHDQLREQYEHLKKLETLRDSLTHMIVHDLRSPLMGMITSLQMMEMDADTLSEEHQTDLAGALRSALRLSQMVTGVLDVSTIEAEGIELDIRVHQCVETARAALDTLGGMITERDVTVEAEGDVQAAYDEELVTRVIANLVSNALRFTPEDGSVKVAVRKDENGSARVEVRDTGDGIPAEYHELIFEKFGQVGRGERSVKVSTGLGLAFCKLAVEAHGGRIGVVSQVGEGSTFWFELPDLESSP